MLEIAQFLEELNPDGEVCLQVDADMGQGCPGQLCSKICIFDKQSFNVKPLINLTWDPIVGKQICQEKKRALRDVIKKQQRLEVGGNELVCIISEDPSEYISKSKALCGC